MTVFEPIEKFIPTKKDIKKNWRTFIPKEKVHFLDRAVLVVVSGSRAYGVSQEGVSDVDLKVIYIPEKRDVVFGEIKTSSHKDGFVDIDFIPVNKFVTNCLKGILNYLEVLYSDPEDILYSDDLGSKLIEIRDDFISYRVINKIEGYVKGVSKRPSFTSVNGYDTKTAYHILRLQNALIQIIVSGSFDTRIRDNKFREFLIKIRKGFVSEEEFLSASSELDGIIHSLLRTYSIKNDREPSQAFIEKLVISYLFPMEIKFSDLHYESEVLQNG